MDTKRTKRAWPRSVHVTYIEFVGFLVCGASSLLLQEYGIKRLLLNYYYYSLKRVVESLLNTFGKYVFNYIVSLPFSRMHIYYFKKTIVWLKLIPLPGLFTVHLTRMTDLLSR